MEYEPVKCRVPELLLRIGKDQQWLSDISDLSKQRISDYCTLRKVMNLRTAVLISRCIGCSMDDLYVWERR